MNLPSEIFDDVIVVHTPEELGADQCDDFEAYMSTVERNNIIFDIDNTETLDSRGLAAILDVQDAFREKMGDVKIAATNLMNRKIFEITRLDHQLEVFDSVIDAVKSFH